MANKQHRAIVSCWVLMLVASLDTISRVFVDGRHVFNKNNFGTKPKGTVKSIEVPEDGDVIDCVDIHEQPAFNHPFIEDLQVDYEQTNDVRYPEMYQTWQKYGECPKGTVPIRRTRNDDIHQKQLFVNSKIAFHEYAKALLHSGVYQGTSAYINIWNPKTEPNEFSSAQLWVQSGSVGTLNSLEAGWIVHPGRYHDSKSRLFVHWTNDNYNATGCFDLDCPGFVQINHRYALGVPFVPTSRYNGSIWESHFAIYKDPKTGDWYFKIQNTLLGYWPKSIIPQLRDHAQTVEWGGEILNKKPQNHHTTTQMGSGHFSFEGNRRATFIRNIMIVNNNYVYESASNIQPVAWDSKCYDATIGKAGTNYKTHIYFGGPGYSPQCPS